MEALPALAVGKHTSTISKPSLAEGFSIQIGGFVHPCGERDKAISRRFGRLKTAMGHPRRKKCFHSIRKTVATLLEKAEILEGVAADILGREKQTMTYGLYSGGTSLKQKRDAIHKIAYPRPTAA